MAIYLWERPVTLLDQHFGHGMDPEDIMDWSSLLAPSKHCHRLWKSPMPTHRTMCRRDAGSKITFGKDAFQVCLDVQQFTPEEITVKTVGDQIVIEGKHDEKQDEHGHISRHFVRKYQLPEGYKVEDVISTLSSDGVLSITAPKKHPESLDGERVVPITMIGPAQQNIKGKPAEESSALKK